MCRRLNAPIQDWRIFTAPDSKRGPFFYRQTPDVFILGNEAQSFRRRPRGNAYSWFAAHRNEVIILWENSRLRTLQTAIALCWLLRLSGPKWRPSRMEQSGHGHSAQANLTIICSSPCNLWRNSEKICRERPKRAANTRALQALRGSLLNMDFPSRTI
jgi:hypothetical protein